MGLGFSHGAAQWSCSGFMEFRIKLAKAKGIADLRHFWEHVRPASIGQLCHNDPIFYLLLHSDCDGELTAEQCALVVPRLRELVTSWDDNDWDKRQALRLADGMDEAVAAGEPLEFC